MLISVFEGALFLAHLPDIMPKNEMLVNGKLERVFRNKVIFGGFLKLFGVHATSICFLKLLCCGHIKLNDDKGGNSAAAT